MKHHAYQIDEQSDAKCLHAQTGDAQMRQRKQEAKLEKSQIVPVTPSAARIKTAFTELVSVVSGIPASLPCLEHWQGVQPLAVPDSLFDRQTPCYIAVTSFGPLTPPAVGLVLLI